MRYPADQGGTYVPAQEKAKDEWIITYLNPTKKSDQELLPSSNYEKSPFKDDMCSTESLAQHYLVKPEEEWDKLKKYKKFVVQGECFEVGDYVFVNPAQHYHQKNHGDERDWWKAKILEVRAADAENVYARLVWMFNPEDLPESKTKRSTNEAGRQDYHGTYEVVASNMQDILDVNCFAGIAPIDFWDENDDNHIAKGLYWRQHFNFQTGELSECRKYCKCNKYSNPDEHMLRCPKAECIFDWLHLQCLKHEALKQHWNKIKGNYSGRLNRKRKRKSQKCKSQKCKKPRSPRLPWDGILDAEILASAKPPVIKITENSARSAPDSNSWTQPIVCLGCKTLIT